MPSVDFLSLGRFLAYPGNGRRIKMERAAGIGPATLAWKARALPLCNARVARTLCGWWAGLDSNQRSAFAHQIYSLAPLTTRPPTHADFRLFPLLRAGVQGTIVKLQAPRHYDKSYPSKRLLMKFSCRPKPGNLPWKP